MTGCVASAKVGARNDFQLEFVSSSLGLDQVGSALMALLKDLNCKHVFAAARNPEAQCRNHGIFVATMVSWRSI
jgi:hypothetical protein